MNCSTTEGIAVKEALGKALVGYNGVVDIPESSVSKLVISCFCTPKMRLADFAHEKASAFGIVGGDIGAPVGNGYKKTRKWATALFNYFDGIHARSRFGTGSGRCLFLFNDEGEQVLGSVLSAKPVREYLQQEMPWVKIQQTPSSHDLNIID